MKDFSMPIDIINPETGEVETHQAYVKENSKRYVKSGLIKLYPEALCSKHTNYIFNLVDTMRSTGSNKILWSDVFTKRSKLSYMQVSRIKKQWIQENIIQTLDRFRVIVNPYAILRQATFSEQIADQIEWDKLFDRRVYTSH